MHIHTDGAAVSCHIIGRSILHEMASATAPPATRIIGKSLPYIPCARGASYRPLRDAIGVGCSRRRSLAAAGMAAREGLKPVTTLDVWLEENMPDGGRRSSGSPRQRALRGGVEPSQIG